MLQRQFRDVGVDMSIQLHDGTSISQLWFEGNFDAMLHWWQMPADPELTLFFAADRTPPAGRNINFVNDERLTRLVYAADRTVDLAERKRFLAEAQPASPSSRSKSRSTASPSSTRSLPRCTASRATRRTPGRSGTSANGRFGNTVVAKLLLRRLAQAIPLLLLVSIAVFALIHAAPGGPTAVFLSNPGVRPEDIERLRRALGVDQPLWLQYVPMAGGVCARRLGLQLQRQPAGDRARARTGAGDLRAGRLRRSARQRSLSALLGIVARSHARPLAGSLIRAASAVGDRDSRVLVRARAATAVRVAGSAGCPRPDARRPATAAQSIALSHLVLPAMVLAGLHAAAWTRYLRASMIEALGQPFVSAARARGVPERRILVRHVLRTALLPVVTVVLLDAALLVSGAVVTESVFAWPGLGTLFTEALARRDYPVLMAMLMLASVAIIVVNVAADLFYPLLDPRVSSYERARSPPLLLFALLIVGGGRAA